LSVRPFHIAYCEVISGTSMFMSVHKPTITITLIAIELSNSVMQK